MAATCSVMAAAVIAVVSAATSYGKRGKSSIAETWCGPVRSRGRLLAPVRLTKRARPSQTIAAGGHAGYAGLSELQLAGADLKAGKHRRGPCRLR